jgi:hypothetical protein
VWLLGALAAGCGKKVEATPAADAAPKEAPTSCLHAKNARAFVWRPDPLVLALDVELDWTCKGLAPDELELTDTEMGAKLGDHATGERYRLDKDGAVAEWDDPFLVVPSRLRGLFVYTSIAQVPATVGLRYGGVQILPSLAVVPEPGQTKPPPKKAMRVVATSSEPGKEKGSSRVTALIELDNVPRSAGRAYKLPGAYVTRTFWVDMKSDADGTTSEHLTADRVLDVDEKLSPIETPVASLPVRPTRRFMLAEVSAATLKTVSEVSLFTGEGNLYASAANAEKLVLPKATRVRLDAAPPSADVDGGRTP